MANGDQPDVVGHECPVCKSQNFKDAAQDVAELNIGQGAEAKGLEDAIDALIKLKLYKREMQIATKVVQTADDLTGSLIDIRA